MNNKGSTLLEFIIVLVYLIGVIGWGLNIYKLTQCDFKPSYKAEVIRGIAIFVAPVGAVVGYIDIEDGKE